MPKAKSDEKIFKGYINYRILSDTQNTLKTYYFNGIPKKDVTRLKKQFNNVNMYHFFGAKVTEIKKEVNV